MEVMKEDIGRDGSAEGTNSKETPNIKRRDVLKMATVAGGSSIILPAMQAESNAYVPSDEDSASVKDRQCFDGGVTEEQNFSRSLEMGTSVVYKDTNQIGDSETLQTTFGTSAHIRTYRRDSCTGDDWYLVPNISKSVLEVDANYSDQSLYIPDDPEKIGAEPLPDSSSNSETLSDVAETALIESIAALNPVADAAIIASDLADDIANNYSSRDVNAESWTWGLNSPKSASNTGRFILEHEPDQGLVDIHQRTEATSDYRSCGVYWEITFISGSATGEAAYWGHSHSKTSDGGLPQENPIEKDPEKKVVKKNTKRVPGKKPKKIPPGQVPKSHPQKDKLNGKPLYRGKLPAKIRRTEYIDKKE